MYRWVSGASGITLSIPTTLLRHPLDPSPPPGGEGMAVDAGADAVPRKLKGVAMCDVQSCGVPRKYRLVGDWERGACGMEHLKVLQQVA